MLFLSYAEKRKKEIWGIKNILENVNENLLVAQIDGDQLKRTLQTSEEVTGEWPLPFLSRILKLLTPPPPSSFSTCMSRHVQRGYGVFR